jgi:hypothetical protein
MNGTAWNRIAGFGPSEVEIGLKEYELPARLFRINRGNHSLAPGMAVAESGAEGACDLLVGAEVQDVGQTAVAVTGAAIDCQDVVPIEAGPTWLEFSSEPCKRRRDKSAACKSLRPICNFAPLLRSSRASLAATARTPFTLFLRWKASGP